MSTEKRIVYTRPDGGLSVLVPAPGVPLERLRADLPEDALDPKVVDAADLPADRVFRDAWCRCPSKGASVDVARAKDVCHNARRAKRAAEFAPLDVEATVPHLAAGAEAKRRAVRGKHDALQRRIDAATDEAGLKAVLAGL